MSKANPNVTHAIADVMSSLLSRANRAEDRIAHLEADKARLTTVIRELHRVDSLGSDIPNAGLYCRAMEKAIDALAGVGDVLTPEERSLVTKCDRWHGGPPIFYALLAILDRIAPAPKEPAA